MGEKTNKLVFWSIVALGPLAVGWLFSAHSQFPSASEEIRHFISHTIFFVWSLTILLAVFQLFWIAFFLDAKLETIDCLKVLIVWGAAVAVNFFISGSLPCLAISLIFACCLTFDVADRRLNHGWLSPTIVESEIFLSRKFKRIWANDIKDGDRVYYRGRKAIVGKPHSFCVVSPGYVPFCYTDGDNEFNTAPADDIYRDDDDYDREDYDNGGVCASLN